MDSEQTTSKDLQLKTKLLEIDHDLENAIQMLTNSTNKHIIYLRNDIELKLAVLSDETRNMNVLEFQQRFQENPYKNEDFIFESNLPRQLHATHPLLSIVKNSSEMLSKDLHMIMNHKKTHDTDVSSPEEYYNNSAEKTEEELKNMFEPLYRELKTQQ